MMRSRKFLRRTGYTLLTLFVVANAVAAFHAYKFTHFRPGAPKPSGDEAHLSFGEKAQALLFGVSLPRPEDRQQPAVPFETVMLQSNKRISCWLMKTDSAIGTVVVCHGYGGSRSSMLPKAAVFQRLHYNVLLPDFMGAGASDGNQTTIGYAEAAEVKHCVEYLAAKGERSIVLFGTSMGAAAVMKAVHDDSLGVSKVILECPFGSMLRTVQNRFAVMHVPPFPMANLLVFWGGVENGFNAFRHNPEDYAAGIHCPALLIWGAQDYKVSREETDTIYRRLAGPKKLLALPAAGHNDYLLQYRQLWTATVDSFLAGRLR